VCQQPKKVENQKEYSQMMRISETNFAYIFNMMFTLKRQICNQIILNMFTTLHQSDF